MSNTSTKVAEQVETQATPSIPVARVPDATATTGTAPKLSAKDRMKKLGAAPKVEKSETTNRPEVPVPLEAEMPLRRWIPASKILSMAEKRCENANTEAKEILFPAFIEALWKNKIIPSNPKIVVCDSNSQPEMSAIFQVQDRFTPNNIHLPELKVENDDEENAAIIVKSLVEAGVEKTDAVNLVANELDTQKRRGIRSINELALGHLGRDKQWVDATPAEQAVADKLMDFLDTLTEEEQAIIRRDEVKVTVKKDFMSRSCQYAHAAGQLNAIFRVFEPVNFLSHAAIGLGDDEATKVKKLQQASDEMIGSMSVK